jgi:hypothetical protein
LAVLCLTERWSQFLLQYLRTKLLWIIIIVIVIVIVIIIVIIILILILIETSQPINSVESQKARYPEQFYRIGNFPEEYHITLKPEAHPVIHAQRKFVIHLKKDGERIKVHGEEQRHHKGNRAHRLGQQPCRFKKVKRNSEYT